MADITKPTPVDPSRMVDYGRKRGQGKKKDRSPQEHAGPVPSRPPLRKSITDVTFIMGIPAEEVTENVQEAISLIMNELDHLREQLNFSQEKIRFLEKRFTEHAFLPIMNHRGIINELTRIINHSERTGTTNSFLFIHIKNIREIRRKGGSKAVRNALKRAVNIILENILDTDIIGSLGGEDIGVILTVADKEEAMDKAAILIKALQNKKEPIPLRATVGIHVLKKGEPAINTINAADADLWAGEKERAGNYRRRTSKGRRSKSGRRIEDTSGDNVR